ncbi:hypothetical protein [Jannaschia faecimaris]|uniref:hypothetical protein n=1 Tax=Jannaschia faecimaris TaxID=1244108 RepID=UPI00147E17C0|nr:hypothetical protein [Jannaschia faecimaris]
MGQDAVFDAVTTRRLPVLTGWDADDGRVIVQMQFRQRAPLGRDGQTYRFPHAGDLDEK